MSLNLNRKMHNLWPFLLTVRVATQTLLLWSWYHRLQHKCSCFCPNWIPLHGPLLRWEINLSLNTSLPLLPSPRLHNLRIHQNPAECSWHYIHLSWLVNLSDDRCHTGSSLAWSPNYIGRLTNWHRNDMQTENYSTGEFQNRHVTKSKWYDFLWKMGKSWIVNFTKKNPMHGLLCHPILRFGCSCRQFVPMFSLLEM